MQKNLFAVLLLSLLALGTMMGCATIAQPQGGPRDSLPPILLGTTPPPQSTNFRAKRVLLTFNEYVSLRDPSQEVLLSPPADKPPMLLLKGRSIQVDLPEKLDDNTTYRLDFGNAIADNNEGNRLGGYAYVFSTGPSIDSMVMGGLVLDARTRDTIPGTLLFFFDAAADSIPSFDSTLLKARPEMIFRSDSSGTFVADALKSKPYRIYAVEDKNGNQKYDPGTDKVGLLPGAPNPALLPDFDIWVSPSTGRTGPRRHLDPPQVTFNLFQEEAAKRQTILESKRPEHAHIQLVFNAPQAHVERFSLEGIDTAWLKQERGVRGDTIHYWIATPSIEAYRALPDTLRGEIVYTSQDSVWNPFSKTEKLTLVHRLASKEKPEKERVTKASKPKKEKKARKKRRRQPAAAAAASRTDSLQNASKPPPPVRKVPPKVNPFKYQVQASNPLNPEQHIALRFGSPLLSIDSARIRLFQLVAPRVEILADGSQAPKIERPIPHRLRVDSSAAPRWVRIEADWKLGEEYRLLIPDSVFTDVDYLANDTLKSTFLIADPDKFGTLVLLPTGGDSTTTYLVELISGRYSGGGVVLTVRGLRNGERRTVRYLTPGNYRLRVVEDRNGNGQWDSGSLVKRQPAERVRVWDEGSGQVVSKENWIVEVPLDLRKLFDQP